MVRYRLSHDAKGGKIVQEANVVDEKKPLRDRLPFLTKASYSLGTAVDMWGLWLYPAVSYMIFNLYLGLDPRLVGVVVGSLRFWDAIVDPVVGWVSDNLRSKHGRRRPFILIAGILSGLCLPALFFMSPSWVGIKFLGISVVFWYMIGTNILYIPIISAFTVPYYSLGNEMTPDYEERTSIMSFRSVAQKISEVGNFLAFKFTTLAWFLIPGTGKQNTLLAMRVYTSILGIIMAVFAIIIFFRVKERYYEKVVVNVQKKISILSSLGETLSCKPFRYILIMGFAFTFGTSMVGALGYYVTRFYVAGGNEIAGNNWQSWMGLAFMAGGVIGVPIHAALAHRIGKRKAAIIACGVGICGYGGSWFFYTPQIPWLQTIASALIGMSAASLWMLHAAIGADIQDFDELNTGTRREGSFTACGSYILKFGNAIGTLLCGFIIAWSGFTWDLQVQATETIIKLRASLASLPVLGLIVAIFFILKVSITKEKSLEIRRQLEERRGTV
jgi:glycoside/pentoside/hexuronide:cation symporter, GPH family